VAGTDITSAAPVKIVRSGLSLVREGRRIFRDMTVMENLRLGAFTRRRTEKNEIPGDIDRICELFPPLRTFATKMVGELSGGQQQMVAVGQALASRPKFLLLDEPASGLAPALVDEIYDRLQILVDDGLGIAIVDQSIERILKWSDRYYVLESGATVLSGASESAAIERINDIVLGVMRVESEPAGAAPAMPPAG
jgi:branched-chain amino acid transport system ATP-binding protein